jgi:hypothetical protein
VAVDIQVVGFGINAGSPINRVQRALDTSTTDSESIAMYCSRTEQPGRSARPGAQPIAMKMR